MVEERRARPLSRLAGVADHVDPTDRRVAYWMLNGVTTPELRNPSQHLRYELTGFTGLAPDDELPKSLGHVHVRPAGASHGYPEIVEILHGRIGFLIFDLDAGDVATPSPRAIFGRAWLVTGEPGDVIVLPPDLHHLTIVLDHGPALFADVIDRGAAGDYRWVAAARGGPLLARRDGTLVPNPHWRGEPRAEILDAATWNGRSAADRPIGRLLADAPDRLEWLSDPDHFVDIFPELAARIALHPSRS